MPFVEVGKLQVAEDYEFEKRSWVVERVGWAVVALLLLGALAGAFGGGPLSRVEREARGALFSVEYDRFVHREGPARLRVRYGAAAVREGRLRIALDAPYMEKLMIERIEPQPDTIALGGGRLTYVFSAAASPGAVTFEIRFQDFGRARGTVSLDGERVAVSQLVYP